MPISSRRSEKYEQSAGNAVHLLGFWAVGKRTNSQEGSAQSASAIVPSTSDRARISGETLQEVSSVLRRPHIVKRYSITETQVDTYLRRLRRRVTISPGNLHLEIVSADPRDNHVLSAAVESECDYLVSSDSHLLIMQNYGQLQIVSPRGLFEILMSIDESRGVASDPVPD